jgi:transporter family-2 protein
LALAFAFLAGGGLAAQAFVNGRLGDALGSPAHAAVINQTVGFALLLTLALRTGAAQRAWARLRSGGLRLRWWVWLASANGALSITVTSAAAPKVGVALLTVALVSGQTAGSLAIDWKGLGPSGPRPVTTARVAGVALAITAVALGALGTHRDLHLVLLGFAVVAGAGIALVQASLGQITRITGESLVAGGVSFGVGGLVILIISFVFKGVVPPNGWDAPAELWIGGLIGAPVALTMALTVRRLGVLRLTLAIVAGQSVGAMVIDLIAPAADAGVTLRTVVSILLTFAAVAVSGLGARAPLAGGVRRAARPRTVPEGTLGPADAGSADRG